MRSRQQSLLPFYFSLLTLIGSVFPLPASAQTPPAVVTMHNDNARTGANLQETILNVNNVKPVDNSGNGFGKLFSRKVDGQIYAQPLYVPNLSINGVKHNVVFVATMHASVYAFDADDPNASAPLWQSALVDGIKTFACPINEVTWSGDVLPEIGIIGTPAIDVRNNFLVCVTKTKEKQPDGTWRYPNRLRKIELTTGKETLPGGREIKATVPGTGDGANANGTLDFDPVRHMSRPGLLLQDNTVYIAFGSHGDQTPYHGWVFAYDSKYLLPLAVWCSTPNGKTDPSGYPLGAGGIWQGGQGLVGDGTNVYLETGNGTFDADKGGLDYGDSFVKLRLNRSGRFTTLNVVDYFTPSDQDGLNRADADVGSTGPMLIPGTNLIIGGEKAGRFFVLNTNNMGRFDTKGDNQVNQWFFAYNGQLHGAPIFYDTGDDAFAYVWGPGDLLKKFRFHKMTQMFTTTPVATNTYGVNWPGCTLSLSANGKQAGTAIIWATYPNRGTCILRAFDANSLTELWNSELSPDRDRAGNYNKFSLSTVVNGKVYVPTNSKELDVYGLGKWVPAPVISPKSGTYAQAVTVSITDPVPGAKIYYTLDGTDPTPSSTRYTAPFKVNPSVEVRAKAFATGFGPGVLAIADYLAAGAGLTGNYYQIDPNAVAIPSFIDFTGTPVVRVDPQINFPDFTNGSSPLGGENFGVTWKGKIQPAITGTYTFSTNSDDGVRVTIDGKRIIDDWTFHGATTDTGTITLQKGKKYDITVQFFQGVGGAVIQFYWQIPNVLGQQIVPQTQLYSK